MTINEWLSSGRDYDQGLQLYLQYGRNAILLKALQKGASRYNTDKLAYELGKLAGADDRVSIPALQEASQATRVIEISNPIPAPIVNKGSAIIDSRLPDEVFKIDQEWRKQYAESAAIHSQLEYIGSIEDRRKAAFQILDNFKKIDRAWGIVDEYRETGKIPAEKTIIRPAITDPAKAIQRRSNLRTYISKFKNDPARAEDVRAWEVEVDELNKVIDG